MSNLAILELGELFPDEVEDQEVFRKESAELDKEFMSLLHKHPVIVLIDSWLNEDFDDDEKAWADLKKAIEENRLSYRKRFHD